MFWNMFLKLVFETCFPHFPRPMDKSRPDQSELNVWCFLMCWQCFSALVRSGKCRWDDLILWRRLLSSAAERILASWNQLEQGDSCPRALRHGGTLWKLEMLLSPFVSSWIILASDAHLCTDAKLSVDCQRCTLLRPCESQTNAFQPSFIRWAWDRHWQT